MSLCRLLIASSLAVAVLAAQPSAAAPSARAFPEQWVGYWVGTLTTLSAPDSVRNQIPVSLEIRRESSGGGYGWQTIFNADTVRGRRPYRLLVEDAARGLYTTGETNGVLLDDTWIGGVLTSVFEVQGRVLQSRYELRGDTLTHELTWWSTTPTRVVRGEGANAEGGASIRSFRVTGLQRAVMVRQRE